MCRVLQDQSHIVVQQMEAGDQQLGHGRQACHAVNMRVQTDQLSVSKTSRRCAALLYASGTQKWYGRSSRDSLTGTVKVPDAAAVSVRGVTDAMLVVMLEVVVQLPAGP